MRSEANAPSVASVWIAVSALVISLLFLAVASDRAAAATGRPYLETIPTTGTNPGALTADAAGNLYLGNTAAGGGVVEKLDANGNPVNFSASASYISGNKLLFGSGEIAVSKVDDFIYLTRGALPVLPGGEAAVFASSGEQLGKIPNGQYICGVGVNPNSGDVYLGAGEDRFIPRFEKVGPDPANYVLTGRVKMPLEYNGACNVEVDSTGAIYASTLEGQLVKFAEAEVSAPTGTPTVAPGTVVASYGARATAVSVESPSDNVFADLYERGYEYGPGGGLVAEYPALGGSAGAVFSGGKLLVSRRLGGILVFGGLTQLPIAKTEPASDFHPDEITLNGQVDPDSAGNVTGCEFKYGTDQRYADGSIPCGASLPITSATAVSAQLAGLTPGTTYHYQLVAENGNGVQLGADQTFTTLPAVESVVTGEATDIAKRLATLHGSYVGRRRHHYYFEFGPNTSYGQTVPAPPGNDAGSVTGPAGLRRAGLRPAGRDRIPLSPGGHQPLRADVRRRAHVHHAAGGYRHRNGVPDRNRRTSAELQRFLRSRLLRNPLLLRVGRDDSPTATTRPSRPATPSPPGSGTVDVPPVTIAGLEEGVRYHYRVVATN